MMISRTTFFLGLLALAALHPTGARAADTRPNIIFILTDDQRWNALGCMGDPVIQTPNIDRLAARGVLFRNHFVTTSICWCSRASIFTGEYVRRHHIQDSQTPLTAAQWAATYPALLRQHGYRTGFVGKFGVGNPAAIASMATAFDYWHGLPGQGGQYFIQPNDPTRTHTTARIGQQALEFLEASSSDHPFCLSISFNAPHARDRMFPREYTPDDRDESLYANVTIPDPPTADPAYFDALPKTVQQSEGRRRWHWRFDTPEKYQRNAKDYYRLISGIDREVGRIMAELDKRGLAQNTVVIFTSDNGYFLGDRGLSDKFYMYEEGLRDPLIILDPRQPRRTRGRSESAMTLNIDFAPTMLDLAGIRPPAQMQGRSLVPLIDHQPVAQWRRDFFYEHHAKAAIIAPSEGVRTERYSYIRWVGVQPVIEQLFDVIADPLESHDLAHDPARTATLAQLRSKWEHYSRELQ